MNARSARVNLKAHISTLPPFVRQLFWVYYAFIGLCLVSFGFCSVVFAGALAQGTPLARGICLFLATFWLFRLYAATFVFDVQPYLKSMWLRMGYYAANSVFFAMLWIYLLAAWKGGSQ